MSSHIPRRDFLSRAAGAAAMCAVPAFFINARAGARNRPPNIVFIMADDLGYNHLGCYGQTLIDTPNIDRLASEGMRFTETYAGCAVCAPSRSTLMTGMHMGHTPVRANSGGVPLRPECVTVAEVLRNAGYATGGFGKWGLGEAGTSGVPTRQGFDEYVGYLHQIHAHFYYPEYLWKNETKWPLPGNTAGGRLPGRAGGMRAQYAPDEIMEHALSFIRANSDRPFFCYVPSVIPHVELEVPEEDLKPYLGRFEEKPFFDPRPGYSGSPHPRATFAAMISHLDKNVGRILALLSELRLEENTIVFFTSDNGAQGNFGGVGAEFFDFFNPMGPFRGKKGTMYEGGLRVPMIARWPGKITPRAVNRDCVWYFPDVLPTFAGLAGVRPPENIDGISIVPSLLGMNSRQTEREFLYWELGEGSNMKQAVRMGSWKAVRNAPGQPLELYNLAADPGESKNLSGEYPGVIGKIVTYLSTCRNDPYPQVEPVRVKDRLYR